MKLNYGTLVLFLVGLALFAWHASGLPWTANRVVGVVIVIPSLLLLILARVQLGRAFSVQAKASTLVTSGLYSRIRNPIYVFGALMIAGFIIWFGRPRLLLFLGVIIALQIYRARNEAKVLEEAFGEEYREYKKKTWF